MNKSSNGFGSRFWLHGWRSAAMASVCLLMPAMAHAQVAVSIVEGSVPPHALSIDFLPVQVEVSSDEEIVSVSADTGAETVTLTYDELLDNWSGTVPVAGERGRKTLTVTAISASGVTGTATARFFFSPRPPRDPPPYSRGLTVHAPQSGAIAQPMIEVWATYEGPSSAALYVSYVAAPKQTWEAGVDPFLPVDEGPNWVQGVVDLSAFGPGTGNLVFVAADGYGDIAHIWVPIEIRAAPDDMDAGIGSDAGPDLDAAIPEDAATDAEASDAGEADASSSDAGEPWSDAGEPIEDAGACADAGTMHGWKPHGHWHHHRPRWLNGWGRLHCSAAPERSGTPLKLPTLLTGLLVLLLIARRRRA